MPSETLHIYYRRDYRQNRRREHAPGAIETCVRFILILLVLSIVIAVLIKLGFIQEAEPMLCDAAGFQCILIPSFQLS